MKHKRRKARRKTDHAGESAANFVRGFVATGLLAAFELRGETRALLQDRKRVLRLALEGGTVLAAGGAAAAAVQRRDYGMAAVAVAGGAAGLMAIDHLLGRQANDREKESGQEGTKETQESAA